MKTNCQCGEKEAAIYPVSLHYQPLKEVPAYFKRDSQEINLSVATDYDALQFLEKITKENALTKEIRRLEEQERGQKEQEAEKTTEKEIEKVLEKLRKKRLER